MAIVRCPRCRKRFDTQAEEPDDLPEHVSAKAPCPACGQWVRIPEGTPASAPNIPSALLQEMMDQSRLVDEGNEEEAKRQTTSRKPWWKFW